LKGITAMTIYCTYLTTYSGNKLPPFYIGSSSIDKIENGYRGSVSSKLYKKIWDTEVKHNPHLFKTKVITTHNNSKSARTRELQFHIHFNVVRSSMYANQALAKPNGFHGSNVQKENHPRWGMHHSTVSKCKIGKKNKGKIPHNKCTPMPDLIKKRISNTKKLNPRPAPNKGKTMNYSTDALDKICRAKVWRVIYPTGTTAIIKNLRNFCKENSLNERAMRDIATGVRKSYNGWSCLLYS
jgi:hypothetical protein